MKRWLLCTAQYIKFRTAVNAFVPFLRRSVDISLEPYQFPLAESLKRLPISGRPRSGAERVSINIPERDVLGVRFLLEVGQLRDGDGLGGGVCGTEIVLGVVLCPFRATITVVSAFRIDRS